MRILTLPLLLSVLCIAQACAPSQESNPLKPRLVILTDIAPNDIEPDDMESLIRLLVHADLFEIEAIVATTGWSNNGGRERMDLIEDALHAYEKDLPNLMKRSNQENFSVDETKQPLGYWPSVASLRARTILGSTKMGIEAIGEGNDSEGSEYIITLADEADDRPLWISVWGGGNTIAQAIWRVQQDRSPEELKAFLKKLRVYTITDQDRPWSRSDTVSFTYSAHQWMRKFEKDLMFYWDECAWLLQNGKGVEQWETYATHIQQHGNLGALYPRYKWGVEGDTPAFLHVMPNGLSDPDEPTQVSWSGYFNYVLGRDSATYALTNHAGPSNSISTKYFHYFYPAMFNNFQARMDWAKEGKGNRNPHVVINKKAGIEPIILSAKPQEVIQLDASQSSDQEGDALAFSWWVVSEAGSYTKSVALEGNNTSKIQFTVPEGTPGQTIHVVCEVTDDGDPSLTSYRRVILYLK